MLFTKLEESRQQQLNEEQSLYGISRDELNQLLPHLGCEAEEAEKMLGEICERYVFYFERHNCRKPVSLAQEALRQAAREIAARKMRGTLNLHCFKVAKEVLQKYQDDRFRERLAKDRPPGSPEALRRELLVFFQNGGGSNPDTQTEEVISRAVKRVMEGGKNLPSLWAYCCNHLANEILRQDWKTREGELMEKFWQYLHSEREKAGQIEETIRGKLKGFFVRKSVIIPEELADETISRIRFHLALHPDKVPKLVRGNEVDGLRKFFYAFARNVLHEYWDKVQRGEFGNELSELD